MNTYEISYALFKTFVARRAYNSCNKDWNRIMIDKIYRLKYRLLVAALKAQADKRIRETITIDDGPEWHEICNGHETAGRIIDIKN
jgi:hypothetical protein